MQKPWYKQFWPWFLIALPVTVMCVCATIIYLSASQGGFSMVVDDYYKRGKTINAVIEHVEKAKQLGISFNVTAHDGKFTIQYASGQPKELTALTIKFVHATQAANDFQRQVTVGADGVYRTDIPADISGKYTITVTPHSADWKVSEQFYFPLEKATLLEPNLYGV
ncbi:hypothetical protein BFR57_08845 [Idiomarina sp. MD25a]|uniref:FixH family protein n=1 Tax=Idiomarina sp. MD25a TaxID=1889913 RepID=UPI0008F8092B|nr:FixH family protein [Idiomarina sp. MD25a]OIN02144.1 hypothetical protein BFR57_08845 [Idiomarina sp. MD25a]